MKTQELGSATGSISDYVREASAEPVVFTVDGKPVAALVPMDNTDEEAASLSTNPRFVALIERSRTRLAAEGGLTDADLRRRLGLDEVASS